MLVSLHLSARTVFSQDVGEPLSEKDRNSLTEIVSDLNSADPQKRKASQQTIYDLGPDRLKDLRKIKGDFPFLDRLVGMHDKLTANDEKVPWMKERDEAYVAIQYFSEEGVVKYLMLGLQSRTYAVRSKTVRALVSLDDLVRREHLRYIIASLISYLENNRWEDIHFGNLLGHYATVKGLSNLIVKSIGELIDVDVEENDTDGCIKVAKKWLKESRQSRIECLGQFQSSG